MRLGGLLYLLAIEPVFLKVQATSSIQARKSSAIVEEGSSFKFEWDYVLQSSDKGKLREIIFGLWEKGYTSSYFITVSGLGKAVENPRLSKKHANYVGRVKWVGDLSKSYLAFQLNNIKRFDNNTYGCQLDIGGFGQTIDSKITLTVKKASVMVNTSTFLHVPQLNNVTVGHVAEFNWGYRLSDQDRNLVKTMQLSCPTYNHHKHRILWRNDSNGNQFTDQEYSGRLLVSNETKVKTQNYHHTKHCSFKLCNVTLQDERYYEIKIEVGNTRKHFKSRVFLTVNEYPRIETSPQAKSPYNVGEQLNLVCKAKGKPAPKISWIRNGRIIPDETEWVYHVNEVSVSDAGVYSCRASNQLGSVTSPGVHVHVLYAPTINFPSETQTVLSWKGNPTRLGCVAVGYPAPVYSWHRAGHMDEELGNASVLTITPSADSDFANYTCIAKNIIGQDSAMFLLKPISPPSPLIITNIDVNYNAIKLTWETPPSKQDTPITGHVLQIQNKQDQFKKWEDFKFSAKGNYFILRNLSEGTHYGVRLYATNVAGKSNVSEEKQVKTPLEGRPAIPKVQFTDVRINHTRFLVTWDYPDDNGGTEVIMFTVCYRAVRPINNTTAAKWATVNVTRNSCFLKLNCCLTYELLVIAWNRNGPSFTDPDNAARITVIGDIPEKANTTVRRSTTRKVLKPKGSSKPDESKTKELLTYLPYVSFLALPVLVCVLRYTICKRTSVKLIKLNDDKIEELEDEMEIIETAPIAQVRSWEFPRRNLAIERVIGNGAFGVVSKAYARGLPDKPEWTIVAVKSLQDDATESERQDLLSELSLLKKLKPHPHIIKLLGCITEDKDYPYMIIEYVPHGDLLGYLRRSRGVSDCYYDDPDIKPMTNLTSEQMLKFAWQISDGMRYISSKKIIHRDLAARNVLVGENHRCKITDFGMARDVEEIYLRRSEGRIPVKWTAIEAMTGAMKYSTKSDVYVELTSLTGRMTSFYFEFTNEWLLKWSFGVVLYEICTIGAEPYPGVSPYRLPSVLQKGYRIPKPEYFKDELYDIMMKCWEMEPENRPSFDSLCTSIRRLEMRSNQNYVNVKDCLEAYESENIT